MQRSPRQARSAASMERMLDAAESLLSEGGVDALTVDAVVARSDTSTGSFYARFGDRAGLLVAVQARFLDRMQGLLAPRVAAAVRSPDLERALRIVVTTFLGAFRTHRTTFLSFMLQNRQVDAMRDRGNAASQTAARAIRQVIEAFPDEVRHPDPTIAADHAFRTLLALAVQGVRFEEREVTGRRRSGTSLVDETVRMLHAYLTTGS